MFLKHTTEKKPRKIVKVHSRLFIVRNWPFTGGIMVCYHDILHTVEESSFFTINLLETNYKAKRKLYNKCCVYYLYILMNFDHSLVMPLKADTHQLNTVNL
jgi:hypothetical protein